MTNTTTLLRRVSSLTLLIAAAWLLFLAATPASAQRPAVVIDVCTPAEFAAGHVVGAINIPVDRIGDEIGAVPGIAKDTPILLYCRSGSRSERALATLRALGYTSISNGGGLNDMKVSGQPVCAYPSC